MNPNYTLQQDVPFLGSDRKEKLDVWLPAASFPRPLPVVLLIHGGGWRIGDKYSKREQNIGATLASHGYAVFSINYLLNVVSPAPDGTEKLKVAWPQNLWDCKSGLRYIRKNAATYGIDASRIAVMGGSAGGSFSMLLGCTANVPEMNEGGLYRDESTQVSCIVNLYGVPDVQNHRTPIFAGDTDEQTRENARRASPVTWLHQGMPPMLIAHGSADKTISVDESRQLCRRLQDLGVDYWYIEIAGAPHTFHLQPEQMDLRPLVLTFLEKHLRR